eukprot:350929-Chlamydomonas_euryale.AAC.2
MRRVGGMARHGCTPSLLGRQMRREVIVNIFFERLVRASKCGTIWHGMYAFCKCMPGVGCAPRQRCRVERAISLRVWSGMCACTESMCVERDVRLYREHVCGAGCALVPRACVWSGMCACTDSMCVERDVRMPSFAHKLTAVDTSARAGRSWDRPWSQRP